MADADEDVVRSMGTSELIVEDEEDAEGFLDYSQVHSVSTKSSALPRRGLKDFEPDPTKYQASLLETSREAMSSALSFVRTHAPKGHVVGYYNPRNNMTRVQRPKGTLFQTVGIGLSGGGVDLFPEEALWAVERGSLSIQWDDSDLAEDQALINEEDNVNKAPHTQDTMEQAGVQLSLQGAYALLLGQNGEDAACLTLEKYLVYAGLKRSGYIVRRAENFDATVSQHRSTIQSVSSDYTRDCGDNESWMSWLHRLLALQESRKASIDRQNIGPLVKPGIYRSYYDLFHSTCLIRCIDPRCKSNSNKNPSAQPSTTYNVYRPSSSFRKSSQGPPDFRICVIPAEDMAFASLSAFGSLMDEQQINPTRANRSRGIGAKYSKLKEGYKSVILAIVDHGMVSYLNFSDAGFGVESTGNIFGSVWDNLRNVVGGKGSKSAAHRAPRTKR